MSRRGSHLARIGAVIGLAALVAGVRALPAAAAEPALTLPPERLYTLVDVPIPFTGTDPISGDDRSIVVTATDDGCAPAEGNDWTLDGCARVQLDVAHGQLAVPLQTTLGGVGEPDGIATGGAIVDGSTDGDGTGLVVNLNGTQDQLNDALALLTYTPDSGYEYTGSNPETLGILVADGTTPADNTSHDVEIFVEQLNDGPDLTVPGEVAVAAGASVSVPAVEPMVGVNGDLYVEDPDITEGEGDDEMLFVMVATCGQFSLRGGALTFGQTIEDLLTSEGVPDLAITAILAALPSEVTGQMFATGSPTDLREGLAAIATFEDLNYALSQVDFVAPATDGTCDLWTIVTDLGNNGLPFQYIGSPLGGRDDPEPGVELPDLGLDLGITTFVVGEGVELTLPTNLSIAEGSTLPIPVATSSAVHPAVDLTVGSAGISATSGTDFTPPAATATYPENDAGPLTIDLPTLDDPDDEPDETLTVTVDLAGLPPGVTLVNDTVTVTIVDDDAPGPDTTDPTVTIEQAAGQPDPTSTSPITFDVEFSEPVTGLTIGDIDLTTSTVGGPPTVTALDGSGTTYTVEVSGMTTDGDVIATISAGAAMDAASNPSAASTSTDNAVTWQMVDDTDTTDPVATLDEAPGQVDPTDVSPVVFRLSFDEPVTDLTAADIETNASTVGGALAVTVDEIDAATYDLEVTGMTTAGDVTIVLPAATVIDAAGNPNAPTVVVDDTVTWSPPDLADVTVPTVVVDKTADQPDPTSVAPIRFVATFSEPVTGFDADDVLLDASTAGGALVAAIAPADAADDTVFIVTVTGMTTAGDVSLAIVGGAATDAAGNASLASTSVDNVVAWTTIAVDDGTIDLTTDPYDLYDPYDPYDSSYDPYDSNGYDPTTYAADDGYLARTGLDVAGLLVLGTGVVGLGLGLVLVARRPWGRIG